MIVMVNYTCRCLGKPSPVQQHIHVPRCERIPRGPVRGIVVDCLKRHGVSPSEEGSRRLVLQPRS